MGDSNGRYVARFAVAYTLLALAVIGSGVGVYAALGNNAVEHRVAKVEAKLGDQNLTRLADKAIADAAQAQGFAVKKIVVKRTVQHGDTARVTATVTVTDGVADQTVELVVTLQRGVWTVGGITGA